MLITENYSYTLLLVSLIVIDFFFIYWFYLFISPILYLLLPTTNMITNFLLYKLFLNLFIFQWLLIFEPQQRAINIFMIIISKFFSILIIIMWIIYHIIIKSYRLSSINLFSLIINIKSKLSFILSILSLSLFNSGLSLSLSLLLLSFNSLLLF